MTEGNENSSNKVVSTDVKIENISLRKRVLKKLGQVDLGLFSAALVIVSTGTPAEAVDIAGTAKDVVGSEGSKNQALKIVRSKPSMSIAAVITCVGCLPAAEVAGSM